MCKWWYSGLVALLAVAILLPATANAQTMEQRRDQKLAQPFLENGDWVTDYDEALEQAKETGKPIFTYFTRSYSP